MFCYLASAAINRRNWKEKEHFMYDKQVVSNILLSMKSPDIVGRYGLLPWYNELPLAAEIALFG